MKKLVGWQCRFVKTSTVQFEGDPLQRAAVSFLPSKLGTQAETDPEYSIEATSPVCTHNEWDPLEVRPNPYFNHTLYAPVV